jgi:hypothetical protein
MALYGSETWTHFKVGKKYLDSFEVWCWKRMGRLVGLIM